MLKNNAYSMESIEVKPGIKIGLEDIFNSMSKLDTPELEKFFHRVANLLDQRKKQSYTIVSNDKAKELL